MIAQSKRSPLNIFYKDFYQNMISKIGMKIRRSNEERMRKLNKEINSAKDEESSITIDGNSPKHIDEEPQIDIIK